MLLINSMAKVTGITCNKVAKLIDTIIAKAID
jgi:hypothetical protein